MAFEDPSPSLRLRMTGTPAFLSDDGNSLRNLPRRASPAGDRARDRAGLVARRLTGEVQRPIQRLGQRAVGLAAADAEVAVGAAAEGIGLPVVHVDGIEPRCDATA